MDSDQSHVRCKLSLVEILFAMYDITQFRIAVTLCRLRPKV